MSNRSHITMSMQGNGSTINKATLPEFEATDINGWYGSALEDAGLFTFIFKVDAGAATYTIHSDPAEWVAYVVSGGGTLYCGDEQGNQTESIAFEEGDFITFKADTPHGWKNGDTQSKLLFVKQANG